MQNMPKLLGEVPVDIVTSKGTHVKRKKYHGPELVSLFKHFSGAGQAEAARQKGGVNVQINFGEMGITRDEDAPTVYIDGEKME
jgi:hypothetical protein